MLEGVRVLELTDWIAGPFAGAILGDFGAEVVRVEMPDRLDHTRHMGPLAEGDDRSPTFMGMARNKQSVCIDLTAAAGAELFTELLGQADVLVTNLRTSRLADLGWPLPELPDRFPQLVVLAISGFGLTGPWHDRGAVDRVAQAFGGLTYLTGDPDRPPTRAGLAVADYMAGWVGALGAVLGLVERSRSGRGQLVDLALYEPILSMAPQLLSDYVQHGQVAERTGNEIAALAPGGTFRSRDGRWLQISASSDVLFRYLMRAVGREELGTDPRLATAAQRHAARDELMGLLSEWTGQRDSADILMTLGEHGVPCGTVNSIADLVAEPQVAARGNVVELVEDGATGMRALAPLPRLSRTPGTVRAAGPHHGSHTRDVLASWLGLDEERIALLEKAGAVGSVAARASLPVAGSELPTSTSGTEGTQR